MRYTDAAGLSVARGLSNNPNILTVQESANPDAEIISISVAFVSDIPNKKEKATQLKVLSYNLRFGELASLQELADFIKEYDPDVVALQEVDSRTFRERAEHQNDKDFATELGFLTGMFSAYGKTIPYKNGYYGIAIYFCVYTLRLYKYRRKTGTGGETK